jgi:hypothetical protein
MVNQVFKHIKNKRKPRNKYYLTQGWFALRLAERNITDDERDELEDELFRQAE